MPTVTAMNGIMTGVMPLSSIGLTKPSLSARLLCLLEHQWLGVYCHFVKINHSKETDHIGPSTNWWYPMLLKDPWLVPRAGSGLPWKTASLSLSHKRHQFCLQWEFLQNDCYVIYNRRCSPETAKFCVFGRILSKITVGRSSEPPFWVLQEVH